MTPVVWLGLAGLLALLLVKLYQRDKRLAGFPGPLAARYSDLWQIWFMYKDRANDPYRSLHNKYGKVVRMAPNKLYFSDPAATRDIFGLRRDFKKSNYYTVSAPVADGHPVTNLFASTDASYHDSVRRAVQPHFNMSAITQYESAVDEIVALFVKRVKERFADKTDEKGIIDLARWTHYLALDAVNNITYSKPYGFLDADEDLHGMIKDIEDNLTYQVYVGQAPWLDKLFIKNPIKLRLNRLGLFNTVSPPVPLAAMAQTARLEEVHAAGTDKDATIAALDKMKKPDILDKLIRVQAESPAVMNDMEILKLGLAVVFAGADSTAVMITAIFYYLMQNPRVYAKLRNELDDKLYGQLSNPADVPTFQTLQKIPYLDAVIKESMRKFGVVRFTPERVVPPEGATIAGHAVPAGTVVGANPFAIQHDKDMFGADAEDFRPERWTDAPEPKYREMANNLMLFGYGKYMCLGQNISLLEMFKTVPEVVRNFDFSMANPNKPWKFKHGLFVNLDDVHVRVKTAPGMAANKTEMNGHRANGHANGVAH